MTETATPTEFKNDQLHAVLIHKPACRIELRVKTTTPLIEKAKGDAIKAVGKEATLPGFRKGKAPVELVQKKYPQQIEKELHSTLANLTFQEAQKLTNTPLLNQTSKVTFDLQKIDENGAEITFSFETEPTVPSIDPTQFHPKKKERPNVGDKEIDEAIRQARFFFAEWKPIIDRPIQEGDFVMIDLDTIENEKPERVFHSVRFEVVKERMAEWMYRLIVGASVGESRDGISEPDQTLTEEERKEFKPKKVRITILKLEEAKLPDLNDEFAHKIGAKDTDDMRQKVAEMLYHQLEDAAHQALREEVNVFLVEKHPFELPQSLIDMEKDHRIRELSQNPQFVKEWETMPEKARESFKNKLDQESTRAVQLFYLSRQIVRDANIGITHKEVQDEAIRTLRAGGHQEQIPVDQIPKEVFALALSKVILARAQDYIIEKTKN